WAKQPAQQVSVESGEQDALWLNLPLVRRGWVYPPSLRVESRYPLGLLKSWSLVALDHACLAWPCPEQHARCPADGGNNGRHTVDSMARGGSEEFRGLREYRPGDSPQLLDWKGYARGRGLTVKQFGEPAGAC